VIVGIGVGVSVTLGVGDGVIEGVGVMLGVGVVAGVAAQLPYLATGTGADPPDTVHVRIDKSDPHKPTASY